MLSLHSLLSLSHSALILFRILSTYLKQEDRIYFVSTFMLENNITEISFHSNSFISRKIVHILNRGTENTLIRKLCTTHCRRIEDSKRAYKF